MPTATPITTVDELQKDDIVMIVHAGDAGVTYAEVLYKHEDRAVLKHLKQRLILEWCYTDLGLVPRRDGSQNSNRTYRITRNQALRALHQEKLTKRLQKSSAVTGGGATI